MTLKSFYAIAAIAAVVTTSSFAPLPNETKTGKSTASKYVTTPQAVTKWTIDKPHCSIKFSVTHMVVSEVEGSFKLFDGTMEHNNPDFSDAKIEFTVDVSSLSTDNDRRDSHLKSDDFFNVEKFPTMKFVSTSFTPAGDKKYKLTGNLTIRDVTKPVTFDVTYGGTITDQNVVRSGFKAKTTVNRFDYNLKWSKTTEAGGLVASKDVDVTVNMELKKI